MQSILNVHPAPQRGAICPTSQGLAPESKQEVSARRGIAKAAAGSRAADMDTLQQAAASAKQEAEGAKLKAEAAISRHVVVCVKGKEGYNIEG